MPVVLHPQRLRISRPATPRRGALMGIGDDYGAAQDNAAAGVTADPNLMNEQQTALHQSAPSSSAWDWGAIANITGAVAKLGGAGASVYIANQNQKTQNAQIAQQNSLQARLAAAAGSVPSWVLPVALAGGGLLLLMAMTSKKPSVVFMPAKT